MSFEQTYEKYLRGEATEEEKKFVEEEIAKARKLNEILEAAPLPDTVLKEAEITSVRKAQKTYRKHLVFRVLAIVLGALLLIGVVTGGAIYGTVFYAAYSSQAVSRSEAEQLALRFIVNNYYSIYGGEFFVVEAETEREIVYTIPLHNSYFQYEVEIKNVEAMFSVEVTINAKTKEITDVDF